MVGTFPSELRQEFALRARLRREDERRTLEEGKRVAKDQRDDKEFQEREQEDDLLLVAATVEQIDSFKTELDDYDTATVEALQENEEQIAKAREQLKQMLKDAYTLPDGRKVFRSEDGLHVFDQNGVELKQIDPAIIEDWRPTSEAWQKEQKALVDLTDERQDLLRFQTELDNARKLADDGHMTKGELEDLEKRLKEDAPPAVAAKVSSDPASSSTPADLEPQKLAQTFAPSGKLDMPAM